MKKHKIIFVVLLLLISVITPSRALAYNKDDRLVIETKKNSYSVKVSSKNKDYILTSNNSKVLGEVNPSFPLTAYQIDLNRDFIPEIITIGKVDKQPMIHVFQFADNTFNEVFSTNNNLFGLLNSSNTRNPVLISLSSKKGDESTTNYILENSILRNISRDPMLVPGLRPLQIFIDTIEFSYEISETPEIFNSNIDRSQLSILWQLDKENYNYSFQYGFFKDISWNSSGDITDMLWDLSFDRSFKSSGDKPSSEFKLSLKLTNTPNGFKISQIHKQTS